MNVKRVGGLITAAGISSRMGEFKPLLKFGEKTMVETVVDKMINGGINFVVIVLGYRAKDIIDILSKDSKRMKSIKFVMNEDYYTTSMLDSISIGAALLKEYDSFFLTPADMPAISSNTYIRLREEAVHRQCRVLFPLLDGYRKHPPLISSDMIDEIIAFKGAGLRELWKLHEKDLDYVEVRDLGCSMDVDNKKDYLSIKEYLC